MDKPIRRTKIIATLGPATDNESAILSLLESGVDIVRLNFSHGTREGHGDIIQRVRTCADKLGKHISIIADLQGPKIRIAAFKDGTIDLSPGQAFTFDADYDLQQGTQEAVGLTYSCLPKDVLSGDVLLVDDGRLVFEVTQVVGNRIETLVTVGGTLSNYKGINRLGGGLSAEALTEKDRADLRAAVEFGVDYIAISFPRSGDDIREAQALVAQHGSQAGIIAKIERAEAVQCVDEIIEAADVIMVARGDLGVEIGDAEVPAVQKHLIELARQGNKAVITATQMLESMVQNPIPTRAEVSDVANAVLDGTDAVMLSAETATGQHPIQAVQVMAKTCNAAEKYPLKRHASLHPVAHFERVDEAIAYATLYTANHMNIKAIIALTESGSTALRMSRIDTQIPIYALSRHQGTLRKMTLYRGVYPVSFDPTKVRRSEINQAAIAQLVSLGHVSSNDRIIITKGDFIGEMGWTNAMKILTV